MSNLFILGNGFDRAHGMPTGYNDFRNFIKNNYDIEDMDVDCIDTLDLPDVPMDGDDLNRILSDHNAMRNVAEFLFREFDINNELTDSSNDERWGSFEKSLFGMEFRVDFSEPVLEKDGVENIFKTSYNNEDIAHNISVALEYTHLFFKNWINSINISEIPIEFMKNTLKKDDYVFSFNYTDTVEQLYDVSAANICHIHGRIDEKLLFGHGKEIDQSEHYMNRNIGTENYFSDIDKMLQKDVENAMKRHEKFFSSIKDKIDSIYSYGFSYENVDMPYIKRLIDMFNTKEIVWLFDDYNREQTIGFKKLIRERGYIGKFSTFKTN